MIGKENCPHPATDDSSVQRGTAATTAAGRRSPSMPEELTMPCAASLADGSGHTRRAQTSRPKPSSTSRPQALPAKPRSPPARAPQRDLESQSPAAPRAPCTVRAPSAAHVAVPPAEQPRETERLRSELARLQVDAATRVDKHRLELARLRDEKDRAMHRLVQAQRKLERRTVPTVPKSNTPKTRNQQKEDNSLSAVLDQYWNW